MLRRTGGRSFLPYIYRTVAFATLLFLTTGAQAAARLGVLEVVEGDVTIKRIGVEDRIRTTPGTPVLIGDTVITGEGARAQVVLTSGAFVNFSSSTVLRFNHYTVNEAAYKSRIFTRLIDGVARFVTIGGSSAKTTCIVETETALISAGKVDIIVMREDKSNTRVFSLAGGINVKNHSNLVVGRVTLSSGETTTVSSKEPPTRPGSFSIAKKRALKKETGALGAPSR